MSKRTTAVLLACFLAAAAAAKDATSTSASTPAPAGDCADPNHSNYSIELAQEADLVVSGVAVFFGFGEPACKGADLEIQEGVQQENGSQVMLFKVESAHKGAVVCRANDADNDPKKPQCLIAVRVPSQQVALKAGQMPPCQVTPGFRYTLLLSGSASASCDGVYDMQYSAITDSIRTHIGTQVATPYPSWPVQDTDVKGNGLAGVLGRTCAAATSKEKAQCTGENDPCTGKAACGAETAVTCVPKVCVGKFKVLDRLIGADPCQPVFISKVSGFPVTDCGVTSMRLKRQARQADKRLTAVGNSVSGDAAAVAADPAPGGTRILGGGSRLLPLPTLAPPSDSSADSAQDP